MKYQKSLFFVILTLAISMSVQAGVRRQFHATNSHGMTPITTQQNFVPNNSGNGVNPSYPFVTGPVPDGRVTVYQNNGQAVYRNENGHMKHTTQWRMNNKKDQQWDAPKYDRHGIRQDGSPHHWGPSHGWVKTVSTPQVDQVQIRQGHNQFSNLWTTLKFPQFKKIQKKAKKGLNVLARLAKHTQQHALRTDQNGNPHHQGPSHGSNRTVSTPDLEDMEQHFNRSNRTVRTPDMEDMELNFIRSNRTVRTPDEFPKFKKIQKKAKKGLNVLARLAKHKQWDAPRTDYNGIRQDGNPHHWGPSHGSYRTVRTPGMEQHQIRQGHNQFSNLNTTFFFPKFKKIQKKAKAALQRLNKNARMNKLRKSRLAKKQWDRNIYDRNGIKQDGAPHHWGPYNGKLNTVETANVHQIQTRQNAGFSNLTTFYKGQGIKQGRNCWCESGDPNCKCVDRKRK